MARVLDVRLGPEKELVGDLEFQGSIGIAASPIHAVIVFSSEV